MKRYIEGVARDQGTLFPDRLDDYVAKDSVVRVIDVVIDDLGVSGLGFKREPHDSGTELDPHDWTVTGRG